MSPDARLTYYYRALLVAYPASYREERGEEILGTLLDAAGDGRTRPSIREAVALVRGGYRVRLALRSPTFRSWWLGSVHLALVLFLAAKAYGLIGLWFERQSGRGVMALPAFGPPQELSSAEVVLWLGIAVAALVAVLSGRYRVNLAMVLGLCGFELGALHWLGSAPIRDASPMPVNLGQLAIMVLLAAALALTREPVHNPPVWMAVIAFVALSAPSSLLPYPVWSLTNHLDVVFEVGMLVALLLSLFDVRVPLAVSLYIVGTVLSMAVIGLGTSVDLLWSPVLLATLVSALVLSGLSLAAQRALVRL
jgi:hypothetical protein